MLLVAMAMLSGCYYHAMAGPALATADSGRVGAVVTGSSGINGEQGGVGLDASATLFDGQYTGLLGVEAFRVWRGDPKSGLQPYVRGALGVLELGAAREELLLGGLSPRAEAGLMFLDDELEGVTLSLGAEYRLRTDGLSTPVLWLQVGFGAFHYLEATSERSPPRPH